MGEIYSLPRCLMQERQIMTNLEPIIEKILWGKSIVEVKDCQDISHLFILRSLTIKESNLAQFIYDKEYERSIENNLFTEEEIKKIYNDTGVWTNKNEEEIDIIKRRIKSLKSKIKAYEFFTSKKRQYEHQLKKEEKSLSDIINEKISLFNVTAENRAEEVKRRHIVMMSTEDENENKYWKTVGDFLEETDFILIYNLAIAYNKHNLFDQATLRMVARSSQWRYRWLAAKMGTDLFGRPISEWSETQNMIVYWSQYYDYIYESHERPHQGVIDDDAACDAWVEEQSKKNSSHSSKTHNMLGTKKATTKMDHNEQFIMTGRDKESIAKVQNMNTDIVRAQLRAERKIIKEKGKVKEIDLRKGMYAK